jgi:ribonuclease BN (tRNA processing enzyme)
MKFTVLGSGTAVQFQKRASASYLLEIGEKKLLLDTGFYLLQRLEELSIKADEIDYIFLSHKHPDHFMGLIHLLFALRHPFYSRKSPVYIFGFKGLKEYFQQFQDILGRWLDSETELVFSEEQRGCFDEFSYNLFDTVHTEESVGIEIIAKDKKIVYTSDTENFYELASILDNSHVAVLECAANPKEKIKGHLSFEDILEINSCSRIKHLILSHFYPDSVPKKNYLQNLIIAEDLYQLEI